ncbi:hypothetical protein N7492_000684 [Penicillium capsulatum]|uniref:Uncharacterized protein n=1 Tax=Penicillium capsulatum TaxID=69766 RepID=A0A9W9LYZ7_9EURO|nr:hypothetical protein N7492_000684 [Penicillium capsulatum]
MSDDEEYYEWDEDFLYEELVPDLVDELAATSYYEAALYEDPQFDVDEYFSDWEYYSDDYYDDDPTVKRSGMRAKASDAATKSRHGPASRVTSSLMPDITSFQGVVWKTPSHERDHEIAVQIYEPGNGDKVALLENWREIFKSAQPALDKSRLRKRRTHETLASDASIHDDTLPCDEDPPHNSSDQMSDVQSEPIENVENGRAESPKINPDVVVPPRRVTNLAVEIPVKRGRKRKADAPMQESKPAKTNAESPRARSKRVAPNKGESDGGSSVASSGRVRRSARQKK